MARRIVVAGVVIVALALGITVGWLVRQPAQEAHDVAVVPPQYLTTPVREGTLDSAVLTGATFTYPVQGELLGAPGTVTAAPGAGATVSEGDAPFEIDLVPQVILQGSRPMFRTLSWGVTGADVTQLQEALTRLGHFTGKVDGKLGAGTVTAWRAFLKARGWAPSTWPPREATQITPAQLAFVATLPARIGEIKAAAGTAADATLATLQAVQPDITVELTPDQRATVPATPVVTILSSVDSSRIPATIASQTTTDSGNTAFTVTADIPAEWIGKPLRASVGTPTSTEQGLIVPTGAVTTATDGATQVLVLPSPQEEPREVPVTVVGATASDTMVTGDIRAGDQVVLTAYDSSVSAS